LETDNCANMPLTERLVADEAAVMLRAVRPLLSRTNLRKLS